MDQVRTYLKVVLKHHFWLLLGVLLLAALWTWYSAQAAMTAKYQESSSRIDSKFSAVENVPHENHPNTSFVEGIKKEQQELSKQILEAWETLYDAQKVHLKWPEAEMGQEFMAFVNQEMASRKTTEFPLNLREIYREHIDEAVPKLYEIVQPRQQMKEAGEKKDSKEIRIEGIVVWDEGKRNELASQFTWNAVPSDRKVRFAQENLWVYEALLNIIKKTNTGAVDPTTAAVKKIDELALGQKAHDTSRSRQGAAQSEPSGEQGEVDEDTKLLNGRYVDPNTGQPLTGGATSTFKELKLIPVYMKLVVDQRKLPDLLVNCANWPLPVEVRQVKLTDLAVDEGAAISRGQSPAAAKASTPGAAGGALGEERGPFDATVEIRGIIYLFNAPDRALLQDSNTGASGAAPSGAAPESQGMMLSE